MSSSFRGMGLGTGIIITLLGIIIFIFPEFSMTTLAWFLGFGVMVMGASTTILWVRNFKGTGRGTVVLITGILCLLFGFFCLLEPLVFAEALNWIIAIVIILFGMAQFATLIAVRGMPGSGIGICSSILIVLFGFLALIWPTFLMVYMGVSLLVEGISVIIMALIKPKY